MTKLADASINTFGNSPQAGFESSYVTVPAAFLEELIGAIQSLKDEVAQLQEDRDKDRGDMAAMRSKLASLESLQESEISRLAVDIATDRRRLAALENPTKEPGKTENARAEKIEKYLQSRPDHKATFETLKGMLQVDNDLLGLAIRSILPSGKYAIIKTPGDKRKRTLVMLPR